MATFRAAAVPFSFAIATFGAVSMTASMAASMAAKPEKENQQTALIFTYGTLKKGFPNHRLMHHHGNVETHPLLDTMLSTGETTYQGEFTTVDKFPLMCGPFKVPFLLPFPGFGHRVSGELYTVTPAALARIDEFEGISKGHYERLPVEVQPAEGNKKEVYMAEAYFAHRSFAEEMLRRGREFLGSYTKKEAAGYVKPADRPSHVPYMYQIRQFLSSPSSSSSSSGPVLRS